MAVGDRPRRSEVSAFAATTRAADVTTGPWFPAVDVIERHHEVVVRADLPGVDRDDVQVRAEPGALHLLGVRRMSVDTLPGDSYHCVERWSGPYARTIRLPAAVNAEQMTAAVAHGVLEVHLPRPADPNESLEVRQTKPRPPCERIERPITPDVMPFLSGLRTPQEERDRNHAGD